MTNRYESDANDDDLDQVCDHRWGPWREGRKVRWRWCRYCPECQTETVGTSGTGWERPLVLEDPPPRIAPAANGADFVIPIDVGARREFMDGNPGVWIRWGEGMLSGPSTVSRLQNLGYEARNHRMSDGTFTVWARRPLGEEDKLL